MRQRGAEISLSHHGEAIDSGMDQKALKTRDARRCQRFNICMIAADYPSPG
jgi:hypothetical protein